MRQLGQVAAVTLALTLPVAATAAGEESRPFALGLAVVASGDDAKTCAEVGNGVLEQLSGQRRFAKATGAAAGLKLVVTCSRTSVVAEMQAQLAKPRGTAESWGRAGRAEIDWRGPTDDVKAAAYGLTRRLLRKLAWDGELLRVVPVATPWETLSAAPNARYWNTLSDDKRRPRLRKVVLSVGAMSSDNLAPCQTFEIGTLGGAGDAEFRSAAQGLVLHYEDFRSYGELYVSEKKSLPKGPLYFRYLDANRKSKALAGLVKECQKNAGLSGKGTLANLVAGDFAAALTTEAIELNAINQRVGVEAFRLTATNGQRVPTGLGVYVVNSVHIGDWIRTDIRYLKNVTSHPYDPGLGEAPVRSQLNVAEAFVGVPITLDAWEVSLGGGIFFAKMNIPYDTPEYEEALAAAAAKNKAGTGTGDATAEGAAPETKTTTTKIELPTRPQILNFALATEARWDDEDLFGGIRLSMSKSRLGGHVAFGTDVNLKLTKTWYVGGEVSVLKFTESQAGAPGAFMPAIGAHIGFDLVRGK